MVWGEVRRSSGHAPTPTVREVALGPTDGSRGRTRASYDVLMGRGCASAGPAPLPASRFVSPYSARWTREAGAAREAQRGGDVWLCVRVCVRVCVCVCVCAQWGGSVCKSTNGKLPRAISRRQFTGGFEQTLWARSGRPLVGDCRARRARRRWLGPVHAHVGAQGNRRGCSTPPVNQPTRPIFRSIPRPIFRPNFPDQSDRCNRATFSCKGATQTTNSRLVATHAPQPSPRSHLASARKPGST